MSGSPLRFLVDTRCLEMRLVTGEDTTITVDTRSTGPQRANCNRSTDCRCGQELDMGVGANCPRCGRALACG